MIDSECPATLHVLAVVVGAVLVLVAFVLVFRTRERDALQVSLDDAGVRLKEFAEKDREQQARIHEAGEEIERVNAALRIAIEEQRAGTTPTALVDGAILGEQLARDVQERLRVGVPTGSVDLLDVLASIKLELEITKRALRSAVDERAGQEATDKYHRERLDRALEEVAQKDRELVRLRGFTRGGVLTPEEVALELETLRADKADLERQLRKLRGERSP